MCIFAACAATTPAVSATQAPTTLDLRNSGLTDVSNLVSQTQLTSIDLRGNEISVADFDALRAALPDCEILWSVPVGGTRFDSNITSLSLDSASDDLVSILAYFPALTTVQFASVPDSATAATLASQYPQIQFLWDVTIAGVTYPPETSALDLSGQAVTIASLMTELKGLPNLKTVTFTDEAFSLSDQIALANAYPNIDFVWMVQLLDDLSVRSDVTELDLRKYKVSDAASFSDSLVLFKHLVSLDMCGSGPSDEEMAAMRAQYPAIKFIWYTRVSNWVLRTDIKGFSTGNRRKFPEGAGWYDSEKFSYRSIKKEDLYNLKYCTDMVALDIGHCTKVKDISFLSDLPQLKYLDIALCDLVDVSVLGNLTELVYLQMMYNEVQDISALKNCTKLRYLNISNNNLTGADSLLGLTTLERLWMNCSGLSDEQIATVTAALPNTVIKASQDNPEYAMSAWCKGNEGYITVQTLYGLHIKYN